MATIIGFILLFYFSLRSIDFEMGIFADFIQLTRYQKRNLTYVNSKSHLMDWIDNLKYFISNLDHGAHFSI